MSYDLELYRKDPKKGLLTKKELEKLKGRFGFKISELDPKGKIVGFYIEYKEKFNERFPEDAFEVYYQGKDKGYYWTSISYGASEEAFGHFIELVKDVSSALNFQITDPQTGDKLLDPNVYKAAATKAGKKKFDYVKRIL